jgi:hypothetical protein
VTAAISFDNPGQRDCFSAKSLGNFRKGNGMRERAISAHVVRGEQRFGSEIPAVTQASDPLYCNSLLLPLSWANCRT